MAYSTASITDANPGPALYSAIATTLGSVTGMSLVDTVVIGARTHKVWKSAAANNSQNLDWYLDISYTTTGAGNISLQCFEFYDPATDLGYRGGYISSSTVIETTYYSRFGSTGYALETNWIGNVAINTSYLITTTTSTFGYWLSATADRIILMLSNNPTHLFYCGFYAPDSLYAAKVGAALYPLIMAKINVSNSTSSVNALAAVTRWPLTSSMAGSGWGNSIDIPTLANAEYQSYPTLPIVSPSYPFVALPVELFSASGNSGTRVRFGTLRDTAHIPSTTAAVRGDTVTINGVQWVLSSCASVESFLFKTV